MSHFRDSSCVSSRDVHTTRSYCVTLISLTSIISKVPNSLLLCPLALLLSCLILTRTLRRRKGHRGARRSRSLTERKPELQLRTQELASRSQEVCTWRHVVLRRGRHRFFFLPERVVRAAQGRASGRVGCGTGASVGACEPGDSTLGSVGILRLAVLRFVGRWTWLQHTL